MRLHVVAWRGPMLVLVLVCAIGGTGAAQWLSLPLPGTPRTPDGKPNLNAPAPRAADGKPDLSGIWRADNPRYNENLLPPGAEAPMLPAAVPVKVKLATPGAMISPINSPSGVKTCTPVADEV